MGDSFRAAWRQVEAESDQAGAGGQARRLKEKAFLSISRYGDTSNPELWDWYTVQGREEVHEKAPLMTTAGLLENRCRKHRPQERRPFASSRSRIRDARERQDHVATVSFGDVSGSQGARTL